MARNDTTSKIIDEVLRFTITSTAIATAIIVPNILIAIEKPLNKYLSHLDKNERAREARRIISYMKSQELLHGEYEHGLKITHKGVERLSETEFKNLSIPDQKHWDHTWRIVFYDIPEQKKSGRDTLKSKLREIGFFQLQLSVWIHPFPCREIIQKITFNFGIEKYVSYIETPRLDNQTILIRRFQKRLPHVNFK